MSYSQPNYAKKKGGGASAGDVIVIAENNFRVPVYEPIMLDSALLLTVGGDLLIAKSAEVPLIVVE